MDKIAVQEKVQKKISTVEKVVIKPKTECFNEFYIVDLRYNNKDTDGSKSWRITITNPTPQETHTIEFFCSDVKIKIKTATTKRPIEGVLKYSISCLAKKIVFKNNKATIR